MKPPAVSEIYAQWAAGLGPAPLPEAVHATAGRALLDFAGLCLAARDTPYVQAALAAWDTPGPCTAIGHQATLEAAGAACINGMAAHGEDYDDTFEGTPVHTGAVVLPAVLAACEAHGRSGQDALRGVAVGMELMCRMALVAPMAIHRAGFHPTAVIGALGAAAGVGAALGLNVRQMTDAIGVAGSMAGGIIEYLAEGTWSKRLHPGWAAQSGLRAALLGRSGFSGPRTVLEGEHGFFRAFAAEGAALDFRHVTEGLGSHWQMENIAFKPYACGTMAQPFIDCAIRLGGRGVTAGQISTIECKVGEGTVHRLWEPIGEKHAPSTAYSAKFSVPYCIAVGLLDGSAGLAQFTEARVADPAVRALAARVSYRIDPANAYPANYTGHLRATLATGEVIEVDQPHLRGGRREPLSQAELKAKFLANAAHGGWPEARAVELMNWCAAAFTAPTLAGGPASAR